MFRQKQVKTRNELMRAELSETVDHAMRAAGHAAGGIRATVGPKVAPAAKRVRVVAADRWDSAKEAFAPLSETAQTEFEQARKRATRRQGRGRQWTRLGGMLAAGVAVGAMAAVVMRWRRQQQWEQYEVDEAFEAAEPPEAGLTTPQTGTRAGSRASTEPASQSVDASVADNRRS